MDDPKETKTEKKKPNSSKPLKFWSCTLSQYKNALPDVERMRSICEEFASQYCFQLERGEKARKEHYQCRLILEEGQKKPTLLHCFESRGFALSDITFSPESNNSIEQGGLSFYVMKDDTRVAGPWHDASYKPKKRKRYEGKDLECMKEPFPFQKQIIDTIGTEADDRTLNWIVNTEGCAGKSKLMKYLRFNKYDMQRVPMGSATQIKTSVIQKGAAKSYFVDLPRVRGSDERQNELFSALEEIKNGWVESAMYGKSEDLLMDPPHIYIFSNEWPNPAVASMDRWVVSTIQDKCLVPANQQDWFDAFKAQVERQKNALC